MTNREFYVSVISNSTDADLIAKAQALLDQLDKENEKRRSTLTKAQKENAEIKAQIAEALTGKTLTASEVAAQFEISTQKASALCRQLVESGIATVGEVKGKNGKVKAYSVA